MSLQDGAIIEDFRNAYWDRQEQLEDREQDVAWEESGENLIDAVFDALDKTINDCKDAGMDDTDVADFIRDALNSYNEYASCDIRP